jgi:hypothetical protein
VIPGITLHVDDAELNVGAWKQAFGDRRQSGEVIVNNDRVRSGRVESASNPRDSPFPIS